MGMVSRGPAERWVPVAARARWDSRGPKGTPDRRGCPESARPGVRVFRASQAPKGTRDTKAFRACRDYQDPKGTRGWVSRGNRDTRVSRDPEGPPAQGVSPASGSPARTDSRDNTDHRESLDPRGPKDILDPPEWEGSRAPLVCPVTGDQARTACPDSRDRWE